MGQIHVDLQVRVHSLLSRPRVLVSRQQNQQESLQGLDACVLVSLGEALEMG